MKKIFVALLSVLLFAACHKNSSNLKLHDIFSSHMVLQRDVPVKVWGTASPGTKIELSFSEKEFSAASNDSSRWEIIIGKYEAGGPFEMTLKTSDTTVVLSDILVGDIFVCSGQSNMEFNLERCMKGAEELKGKLPSTLRIFPIEKDLEFFPLDTLRYKTQWYTVDSPQLAKFSAVGYFFGKNLTEKLNIPIGLIGSNWGGTIAEAWTSAEGLKDIKDFAEAIIDVKSKTKSIKEIDATNSTVYNDFIKNDYYKSSGMDQKWFLPETKTADWKPIEVPSLWENVVPEMKDFDGDVWYRTTFDIPKKFSGKTIELWLGQIDDNSIVWVNGEKIGEKFGRSTWCGFDIAPSILKPKGNIMVVRVYDVFGKGGFSGNPTHFDYYPKGDRNTKMSTAGKNWLFKKGDPIKRKDGEKLVAKSVGPNDYPICLFNAMIHPILQFPVKGAIWYQGESNSPRAYQYRALMKALIMDWRTLWNCDDFPFYYVQLANFMDRDKNPVESEWAELREAQTMALSLPNTGMATIIDIGEANDIHPTNKHDVGKRLALNALKTTYKLDVVAHGPMYKSMEIKGNKVIISFDDSGKTLVTSDKKAPVGFAVAGKDKKFYWADAKIVNNTIVLTCKKVKIPVAVRYAWANNPATNLYNKEGLPAVPFRTDDWPGLTFDKN